MVWISAAVVLLLAVAVPGFRKVILICGAVIVGIVVISLIATQKQTPSTYYASKPSSPPPAPPKIIPPASIEVRDIRSDFSGSYISHVTVRLFNNSSTETLKKAEYRLMVADCKSVKNNLAKKSEDCTTVDDETGSFEYLTIPPQQARDTSLSVQGAGVRILGSPRIDLTVTAAQAE
jgi:hypothetical protein